MLPYAFIILDCGVGISVYGKTGEIQIHLPTKSDIQRRLDKNCHVFNGEIRFSKLNLQVFNLRVGGHIRIFDWATKAHSRPFQIKTIFYTPRINEKISPKIFMPWLVKEKLLDHLPYITAPDEFCAHRLIINSLFSQALINNSFTISYKAVMDKIPRIGNSNYLWLKDLIDAQLVTGGGDTITITSPLIYMMMEAINRRKVMLGNPIFSY